MKNLLLLLALVCSGPLFSQVNGEALQTGEPKQKFSFGILGGLDINNMPFRPDRAIEEGTSNSSITSEYGIFVGVSARQPILKRLAAKLDAQFAQRGFGQERTTFTPIQEHYQASYFDFVPQLEYNVFKNIYLSLGGYGGFLLGERVKYSDQDWAKIDPDFVTIAEKTDWGLSSGLRLEFGRFSALVKYQHGLTPAIKLEHTDISGVNSTTQQFHRSLQVGLGFKVF
ncbi:MAG: outer membrane beta-barrel protein [Lewinellaceae bacterium]|nr:outer membrane beta-barrel protein [Lewinellaceae bacterium]